MNAILLSRRAALIGLIATLGAVLRPQTGFASLTAIRVAKDPNCGCCDAWIDIL